MCPPVLKAHVKVLVSSTELEPQLQHLRAPPDTRALECEHACWESAGPPWPHVAVLLLLMLGVRSHSLLAVLALALACILAVLHARGLRCAASALDRLACSGAACCSDGTQCTSARILSECLSARGCGCTRQERGKNFAIGPPHLVRLILEKTMTAILTSSSLFLLHSVPVSHGC